MRRREPSLLGRLFRALVTLALALVVIVLAALAFFPFERLAPLLASKIERETRIETHIAALGVRLGARATTIGPASESDSSFSVPTSSSWPAASRRS
jgi:hypothetical protein